jgi:hypothetical protein
MSRRWRLLVAAAFVAGVLTWVLGGVAAHQSVARYQTLRGRSVVAARRDADVPGFRGPSLNRPELPVSGPSRLHVVPTCIPADDKFLEIQFLVPTESRRRARVTVGHPLTTQGAGIPGHTLRYGAPQGSWLTEYIPLGTVFDTVPFSDVFAYIPPALPRWETHRFPGGPVWVLAYGDGGAIRVLTGGRVTPRVLVRWSVMTSASVGGARRYVGRVARPAGWNVVEQVPLTRSLTGYLGANAWIELPWNAPVDLVNPFSMGSNVLKLTGIVPARNVPVARTALHEASCRS